MKLKQLMQSEEVVKFLKFGVTGVLNTAVDFLIYTLLVTFAGANIFLSQVLGYACGTLNSYVINRSWTFRSKKKFFSGEMVKFIVVNLITLAVSLLVMGWLTSILDLGKILLKLPVTGVTIILNFLLSRLWVFKEDKSGQDSH